jgi:methylenetetrahydrofolate reductase (NADPH)
VAGYPESHPDADERNTDEELDSLLKKQQAGANFIVTQLFYDVEAFLTWYRRCRDYGITLPILPGIMPIQNYQSFRRMTSLCKVAVPQSVWDGLEPNRHDDAAVKDFGIDLASQLINRIQKETDIKGFHICTLNLENSVKRLLVKLGWVGREEVPDHEHKLLAETVPNAPEEHKVNALKVLQSSTSPSNQPVWSQNGKPATQETPGWDEFPNGRYGDARSPAFGEMDGYGVSLKVPPADAIKLWGYPTSDSDISSIFVKYLQGDLSCIPWCDCPILNETNGIQKELLALNSRGWWTVGSQPSVDGIESTDPTFGFGPRLGYIFQKAFVEFFITEEQVLELQAQIKVTNEKKGSWLSFFAGNRKGDLKTNVQRDEGQSCAVTWGCFVGKEVVQSTIIEEESFKAWRVSDAIVEGDVYSSSD